MMRVSGAARLAAACLLLAMLASYLVADRLLSEPPLVHVRMAVSQQRFYGSRLIVLPGSVLHRLHFVSVGGAVKATWYDSSLLGVKGATGSYVTLQIDGRAVDSTLRGAFFAGVEAGPSTLVWSGSLAPGVHTFTVRATRVDQGYEIPHVQPGYPGVDSLSVVQYTPGG